jgi:hypothetical protein
VRGGARTYTSNKVNLGRSQKLAPFFSRMSLATSALWRTIVDRPKDLTWIMSESFET